MKFATIRDGSADGRLAPVAQACSLPNPLWERPLMYQGMSHPFLGPGEDVLLPSEDEGIDFEGEFGTITDFVANGGRS